MPLKKLLFLPVTSFFCFQIMKSIQIFEDLTQVWKARRGTNIHKDPVDIFTGKRPNEPGVTKIGTGKPLGTNTLQCIFQALLVSYPSPSAPLSPFLVLLIAVSNVNGSLVAASPSRPVLTISDYPLSVAYILKWGPSVFLG